MHAQRVRQWVQLDVVYTSNTTTTMQIVNSTQRSFFRPKPRKARALAATMDLAANRALAATMALGANTVTPGD
jgi:hypothetical protein